MVFLPGPASIGPPHKDAKGKLVNGDLYLPAHGITSMLLAVDPNQEDTFVNSPFCGSDPSYAPPGIHMAKVKWILRFYNQAASALREPPSIGWDGTLYTVFDNHLYAIDPKKMAELAPNYPNRAVPEADARQKGGIKWMVGVSAGDMPLPDPPIPIVLPTQQIFLSNMFIDIDNPDNHTRLNYGMADMPAIGADASIWINGFRPAVHVSYLYGIKIKKNDTPFYAYNIGDLIGDVLIGTNNIAYIGSNIGKIRAFKLAPSSPANLWNREYKYGSISNPKIGPGGVLYFARNSEICAITPTGTHLWPNQLECIPVINKVGWDIVLSQDGSLFRMEEKTLTKFLIPSFDGNPGVWPTPDHDNEKTGVYTGKEGNSPW